MVLARELSRTLYRKKLVNRAFKTGLVMQIKLKLQMCLNSLRRKSTCMHTNQKMAVKSTKSKGHLSGKLVWLQAVASVVLVPFCPRVFNSCICQSHRRQKNTCAPLIPFQFSSQTSLHHPKGNGRCIVNVTTARIISTPVSNHGRAACPED